MALIDEIIGMASDSAKPLTDALRKSLVLAFELKNDKLKGWIEKELNGYQKDGELPDYRQVNLHSKGNFFGIGGSQLTNRPLPLGNLDVGDWDWLQWKLAQPIGAYETLSRAGPNANPKFNWPPDLIVKYQSAFIEGFALSSAWQEIPMSKIIDLCEQVRYRLLRFALEIREELGDVGNKASAVPRDKVETAVNNYIYGGVNVFGGSVAALTQTGDITIKVGDFSSLTQTLRELGLPQAELDELKNSVSKDGNNFGTSTKEWLLKAGGLVAKNGVKVGTAVGTEVLKQLLLLYFGLK